jgi:hypothetical protein
MFSDTALRIVLWALLILPWLSLLLMNKEAVKRYMPVAIFGSVLVTIWNEFAYTLNWWKFKILLVPWLVTNIAFVYGTFVAGTIWIFYFSFRKFWVFLLTNIVVDGFLAFPANYTFQRIGMYRMDNYNGWKVWFTSVGLAIVLYLYQVWQEGVMVSRQAGDGYNNYEIDTRDLFRKREKAR